MAPVAAGVQRELQNAGRPAFPTFQCLIPVAGATRIRRRALRNESKERSPIMKHAYTRLITSFTIGALAAGLSTASAQNKPVVITPPAVNDGSNFSRAPF